jgi:methylthioribose-1-phosphate isomerase
MKVNNTPYRTIWVKQGDPATIQIIDQRYLPHQFVIADVTNLNETVSAVKDMQVRGAPLIGVTAAYGIYLALLKAPRGQNVEKHLEESARKLRSARPTAINLSWAIERQIKAIAQVNSIGGKIKKALETANQMADEDVETCRKIGEHGLKLIETISRKKRGKAVQVLTHCNAGWLACVDWGTATAPIYQAFNQGIPIHIWVSETRPRNQGASLTAWELAQHGVSHTVIVDNAAGHLMQRRMVDLVLVGTDRTTSFGDMTNKIGTYLKALAAKDNHIPFYAAVPSSSIDWKVQNSFDEIPIEERNAEEVTSIEGWEGGSIKKVRLTPKESPAKNYAFDVTPASLVSGLVTERGICEANRESILKLFPERSKPNAKTRFF